MATFCCIHQGICPSLHICTHTHTNTDSTWSTETLTSRHTQSECTNASIAQNVHVRCTLMSTVGRWGFLHITWCRGFVTNGSNHWMLRQPDQVSKTNTMARGHEVLFAATSDRLNVYWSTVKCQVSRKYKLLKVARQWMSMTVLSAKKLICYV